MSLSLTAVERQQWRCDGYFVRERALSLSEAGLLAAAADRITRLVESRLVAGKRYTLDGNVFVDFDHHTVQFEHAAAGAAGNGDVGKSADADRPEGSAQIRVIEPVHDLEPEFARLISDRRLVEPMRALVGSEQIGLWTAKLNRKPAREGSGFRWHQDSPYWIHSSADVDRLPNVFVAFDDADEHNGALRLVRGSHTRGCLPGLADGSQLEGFFTHPDEIDASEIVVPPLAAGSLLFFSPHIIHGSLPNTSNHPRRALIATYQSGGLPELKSARVGPQW